MKLGLSEGCNGCWNKQRIVDYATKVNRIEANFENKCDTEVNEGQISCAGLMKSDLVGLVCRAEVEPTQILTDGSPDPDAGLPQQIPHFRQIAPRQLAS